MAQRWRSEHRLVNPVPPELVLAGPTPLLHHEGLTHLFASDLDGEAVARWAERTAARGARQQRERRRATRDTAVPHRPMEFVWVEGGELAQSKIPGHEGADARVAPFAVQTGIATAGQWVTVMEDLPRHHRGEGRGETRWRVGRRILRFSPERALGEMNGPNNYHLEKSEVVEFLERLNAQAKSMGARYDLPTELELEFLWRHRPSRIPLTGETSIYGSSLFRRADTVGKPLVEEHVQILRMPSPSAHPQAFRQFRTFWVGPISVNDPGYSRLRLVLRDAR
jgi:hypothetical protein